MDFATNLKRICNLRGTTPTGLLKSMGVATNKVTAWNSGSLPKQDMLVRLADQLGCSVMDFFADEDAAVKAEQSMTCEKDETSIDEDELDIIRVYRSLSRRSKHEFMTVVYDFEKSANLERDNLEHRLSIG